MSDINTVLASSGILLANAFDFSDVNDLPADLAASVLSERTQADHNAELIAALIAAAGRPVTVAETMAAVYRAFPELRVMKQNTIRNYMNRAVEKGTLFKDGRNHWTAVKPEVDDQTSPELDAALNALGASE